MAFQTSAQRYGGGKYGNAATAQFIAHAEAISGQQLDGLFTTWLYTKGKPATGPNDVAGVARTAAAKRVAEPKSYKKIQETHALLAAMTGAHR